MATAGRPRGTLDPRLAWGLALATIATVPASGVIRILALGRVVGDRVLVAQVVGDLVEGSTQLPGAR